MQSGSCQPAGYFVRNRIGSYLFKFEPFIMYKIKNIKNNLNLIYPSYRPLFFKLSAEIEVKYVVSKFIEKKYLLLC